jgi:GTP-binding protein
MSRIVVLVAVVSHQNLVPSSHLHCDAFTTSSSSTPKSHFSYIFNQIQQNRRYTEHRKRIEVTVSSTARYSTAEDSQSQLAPETSTQDDTTIDGNGEDTTTNIVTDNNVEYSFYDEVTILARAGSGGQGASTYKKGVGGQNGRPDGGNGGNGGNVILVVDDSLNTLAGLSHSAYKANAFGGSGAAVSAANSGNRQRRPRYKAFRAEIGTDGGRQLKSGRYGKDVMIRVPPGTVVHEVIETEYDDDEYSDDENEFEKEETLIELGTLLLPEQGGEATPMGNEEDEAVLTRRMRSSVSSYIQPTTTLVVAMGGEGGEGSGINHKGRGLQRPRLPPKGGEKLKLRLTLKSVADVALVGVPNAGKSTFLSKVTRAKPRIADYPFTTVIPNLGVWVPPELFDKDHGANMGGTGGNGLVLCDVPGLIEGASRGIGLGHAFLRHVERCHVILHLVDATSEDPLKDFKMLNGELVKYGTGQLARMPQVVVINKIDAYDSENEFDSNNDKKKPRIPLEELETQLKDAMSHSRLMQMSAKEEEGVDDLMVRLSAFVKKVT